MVYKHTVIGQNIKQQNFNKGSSEGKTLTAHFSKWLNYGGLIASSDGAAAPKHQSWRWTEIHPGSGGSPFFWSYLKPKKSHNR